MSDHGVTHLISPEAPVGRHPFHFRTEPDRLTGAVAANLAELEDQLIRCEPGVLRHHCFGHDCSRWVAAALHDQPLAANIATIEAQLSTKSPAAIV